VAGARIDVAGDRVVPVAYGRSTSRLQEQEQELGRDRDEGLGLRPLRPATETYEPSGLPGGQPFGSAVEAYDTAAIVHLTEYAE
jgi:hypothetical protein